MKRSLLMLVGFVCLSSVACTAASNEDASGEGTTDQAIRTFRFTVFDNPYGDGTANPAANIVGTVNGEISRNPDVVSGLKEWTVTGMDVYRLPPNRTFGAHAHALKCDDTQGGGHYENIPGNIDPVNSEIWLDFTTDARGHGRVKVLSPFAVKAGGVQSFVIHTNPTDPATGKAGAKLACANLTIE